MIRSKALVAFTDSLMQSLSHCQYENIGRAFDKDAQYAFSANNYATMEAFRSELEEMILNGSEDRMREYVKSSYSEIAWYGVYFKELSKNYERRLVCNDGKLELDITKYEERDASIPYRRAEAYTLAIEYFANEIRKNASDYLGVDLVPFRVLTMDSFIPGSSVLIEDRPPVSLPPPKSDKQNLSFDTYIVEQYREKLMPYLVDKYTSLKPEQYGFMLYALVSLGHAEASILNNNKTALHRALESKFGKVGTRQNLSTAINRLDEKEINTEDKRQIEEHKQRISTFLKSLGVD